MIFITIIFYRVENAWKHWYYRKARKTRNLKDCGFSHILAEKEGFEPSLRSSRTTPLAGEPLRPLGYFSKFRKRHDNCYTVLKMAERVGFEPTDACASPVFKTGSFDHSDISPFRSLWYSITNSGSCQPLSFVCCQFLFFHLSIAAFSSDYMDIRPKFICSQPFWSQSGAMNVNFRHGFSHK